MASDLRQSDDITVIAPNLNRRLSGVTATVVNLVPLQAMRMGIVATGVGLPDGLPFIPVWRLPFLRRRTRVWHARRNNEMLLGLMLRGLLRMPLKLVFTSSSPRVRGGLTNWLVSRMDAIVATAEANAVVMPGTPTIIPHGVNTEQFRPGTSQAFGASDQKLIGCFGRIREKKGTHHFVRAMCSILPDHPEYDAVIMGRVTKGHEAYAADLHAEIAQAGLTNRIHFVDEMPLTDMPGAYQSLSVFVAPSLLEGFGLTVPEALACEVPVVATDVGAFASFIRPSCGALVPKDDEEALTQAIRDVIGQDMSAMGKAGRAHVVENFSLDKEADALCDLYESLLEHS